MAIDNLNYYSAGLPAGQQTDRYSSQPGCLRSKNLDIFSSSKSVKATAFSTPTQTDSDVIKEEGGLVLKTDGKVYERVDGVDTLLIDPSVNFPVHQVSYTGGSGPYADATRGTVQDMSVITEGDEWKSFIVYTDRSSLVYSKVKFTFNKRFSYLGGFLLLSNATKGWKFKTNGVFSYSHIYISLDNAPMASFQMTISATNYSGDDATISLASIQMTEPRFYYDGELDAMTPGSSTYYNLPFSGSITDADGVTVTVPSRPQKVDRLLDITFNFTKKEGSSTYGWQNGELYIKINGIDGTDNLYFEEGDSNYYYSYLPLRDRKLVDSGIYGYTNSYWMKGQTFQPLYRWIGTWVDINDDKKARYDFVQDMGWTTNIDLDVVGLTVWNEQVYMIGNMDGNGYIIPCDLTGGVGTPYIAYGCTFKGVTNIDYLMYLVGEDRGISCLWVYNGQELVPVIGGREEKDSKNLIKNEEQYKFDGKIVNWRKNLILTTEDNRIFQYGQTFGGKGGTFIHELPSEATITGLKTNGNDLEISYSITESGITTNYAIKYQDDTPIKNYNLEWMAEYPIVLGNHLLEKEESDLYVSYILPSADCSLEFWGMANHYHFRTFTSEDDYTFDSELSYKMKGATGDYELKFIERNGNQYTFRLVGDLPIQTTNDMKITDTEGVELINYSEYNHFRKIGEITTTEYQEGEFRFHNLNNKLELPKSHSLQIMAKGKGTSNYTPELFSVDLVANQRERG